MVDHQISKVLQKKCAGTAPSNTGSIHRYIQFKYIYSHVDSTSRSYKFKYAPCIHVETNQKSYGKKN